MKIAKLLRIAGLALLLLGIASGEVSSRQGPPAARLGDMHTCPLVTDGVPHVGGPITTGEPTVLICGQPAARVSDLATCVGPPDSIVLGSNTVRIGGLPAARLGDPSAHGGVVVAGCPTVKIGG